MTCPLKFSSVRRPTFLSAIISHLLIYTYQLDDRTDSLRNGFQGPSACFEIPATLHHGNETVATLFCRDW